ncbi:MAG: histidine ammonia-lyase [Armatimonadota bacterium]|nr:histidine ammonia-lyase [Armatimonadota bacterium]MDR5696648.1 histidine ammonia-lyase [Armatimonadota bacterium]
MIELDGHSLTPEQVEAAVGGEPVRLAAQARVRLQRAREMVERVVREGRPVYAISTGVGALRTVPISIEDAEALQRNILRSHAAGVGTPLGEDVVRAMLVLRANALAGGYSGVRPVVIDTLLGMLERGVHPVVPEQGSLGASGDLAPLAHLALVLIGEGEAIHDGERLSGAEAMRRARIEPLVLEAKEGIALINGTQLMTALGTLFLLDAERLCEVADVAGALTLEALRGTERAFHPLLHAARPHPGQIRSAARIRSLLMGSERVARREYDGVQDAYSLRCMPQVHGAVRDALAHLRRILTIEMNSATDNPLLFPDHDEILSGGNFHGEPLALALDYAGIAVAELASISERRIERLVNPQLSGLPPFLARQSGLHSGYMLAQYTAASLVSENKVLSHPASADSIPTSANQEDHVSMGAHAARKAAQILRNCQQVLAIELVVAAQGVEMGSGRLGEGTAAAYRIVREAVRPLGEDRVLTEEFERAAALVRSGALLKGVASPAPEP